MYKLPVKIEGIEKRKRSAGILHMLAGIFLLIAGPNVEATSIMIITFNIASLALIIGVISIFYGAMRKKVDPAAKWNHWLRIVQSVSFAVKAIFWLGAVSTITSISLFVWSGITLMLYFTEKRVFKPTELGLSKEGISVPGFYTEHLIPWTLVNDLVVRPDYVTITRENLSYVQLELLADMDRKDLNRINEFAREQLAANKKTELTS